MTRYLLPESKIRHTAPTGIVWLYQARLDHREMIGGKAARLGELTRAGFRVPAGFCLPVSAYRQHVLGADPAKFWDLLGQQDYAGLRAWILGREINPLVRQALLVEYRSLQAQAPGGVAVRSSSTAEDLKRHSFAGLYTSILNVDDEAQLLHAVRACWASYWNEEAVAYRERAEISHTTHGMGVLVQPMAPAVMAGVVFTQVSDKNTETALVEYTRESGEALVSGEVRAKSCFINRKTGRVVHSPQSASDLNVSRLLYLGLQIEDLLGDPQDIEWVLASSDEIWILQTRPVTSRLVSRPGQIGIGHGDWLLTYDEPFSPLGCEIAMERYHYWVKGINASFKTRFQAEIQNQDGLLYYHPAWRKSSRPLKLWMNFWRMAAWLNSGRIYRQYVSQILPDYDRRLQAVEQADLAAMTPAGLLNRLREAIQLYVEFQLTSYAIGSAATLSASLLDKACRILFAGPSDWDALDFLTGINDVSIERELEAFRLGQLLRSQLSAPVAPDCTELDLISFKEKDGQITPFGKALNDYLQTYGYVWADRYPRDPAWKINEEALSASLWIAAQAAPDESLEIRHQEQQRRREEAVGQARAELSRRGKLPGRVLIFNLLLKRAEKLFPFKENRNHQTYRGMMVIRRVAQELGIRLQDRQLLVAAEDVFYLTFREIEMLLNNPKSTSYLLEDVNQRKETYLRLRQNTRQPNPAGSVRHNGRKSKAALQAGGPAVTVHGDPCSPGLAKGPARLVSGPGELQRVRPGEIVVCTQLRPAWSAVFSRAGAVVIEMGSLLSHGSTLAREYGIPAVINVTGITGLVQEDDWLVVDGNLGTVAIERRPEQLPEIQER